MSSKNYNNKEIPSLILCILEAIANSELENHSTWYYTSQINCCRLLIYWCSVSKFNQSLRWFSFRPVLWYTMPKRTMTGWEMSWSEVTTMMATNGGQSSTVVLKFASRYAYIYFCFFFPLWEKEQQYQYTYI